MSYDAPDESSLCFTWSDYSSSFRQAELLEAAPALRAAAQAADKAKLAALERALGITSEESSELRAIPEDDNGESSASGSRPAANGTKKRLSDVDIEEIARKKHKFEDNQFFEESREINENVRSAVAAGELGPFPARLCAELILLRPVEEEEKAEDGCGARSCYQGQGQGRSCRWEEGRTVHASTAGSQDCRRGVERNLSIA